MFDWTNGCIAVDNQAMAEIWDMVPNGTPIEIDRDRNFMTEDKAHWPPVDPIGAGLKGRCPRCGEGRLFSGFLTVAPRCGVCRLDNSFADAGDGPAVFVILIIGFIVVGLALWMEVTLNPPLWVHFMLWIPLTLVLCLFVAAADEGRADHPAVPQQGGGRPARPAGMTAMAGELTKTAVPLAAGGARRAGVFGAAWARHLADAAAAVEARPDRHHS